MTGRTLLGSPCKAGVAGLILATEFSYSSGDPRRTRTVGFVTGASFMRGGLIRGRGAAQDVGDGDLLTVPPHGKDKAPRSNAAPIRSAIRSLEGNNISGKRVLLHIEQGLGDPLAVSQRYSWQSSLSAVA